MKADRDNSYRNDECTDRESRNSHFRPWVAIGFDERRGSRGPSS
jgi:hypothetical protein